MRNALERYFDAMRAIVEGHGGTVEKFVGDAVLAVFGIPMVHEDDALRAVRAAVAMREELTRLRPELGVELRARIGINTGEVVTGEGDTFATGDTMNVAARLEQWAEPDEILIGASTEQLVSDAVHVEALEPLPLKGKAEPVAAFRLLEVLGGDRSARRLMGPFVGRRAELERLIDEFALTVSEGSCRLVAVTGEAGVGKSRLVHELASQVEGDARLLIGRCLSYGEGITYWPLRDVVHQLAGVEPLPELTRLLGDAAVAEQSPARSGPRPRPRRAERFSGACAGCSRRWQPNGRSFWCWTTCTGLSPRFWTSSTTCATSSARHRSCWSGRAGRSSSRRGPVGDPRLWSFHRCPTWMPPSSSTA